MTTQHLRAVCSSRSAAGALLAALLYACAALPRAIPAPMPAQFLSAPAVLDARRCGVAAARAPIAISIAGWHSGIIVPASALGPLAALRGAFASARYFEFGWGNRRFYMAAHAGSGDALAALLPSQSVLLVQGASSEAGLEAGQRYMLCLTPLQLWRLDAYLDDALRRRNGLPVDLGPGSLPDSRFYAASGEYDAFHTCNTWTMAALEYAGLPVRAAGVIFAAQIPARLRRLSARAPASGEPLHPAHDVGLTHRTGLAGDLAAALEHR